jgi:hypothetical protein
MAKNLKSQTTDQLKQRLAEINQQQAQLRQEIEAIKRLKAQINKDNN